MGEENLKALGFSELSSLIADWGWESYRAQQIFNWLWKRGVTDFNTMTDLSLSKRRLLKERFYIGHLKPLHRSAARDGVHKFLFALEDGERIETVYIPDNNRRTVCISTQVGCPLGCRICRTAKIPFKRNLSGWEIADQVLRVQELLRVEVSNVVFMGMGEPLLNYLELMKAIDLLNADLGPNIGARRITVSTAGLVPEIEKLARSRIGVRLAISLNAATDHLRSQLMPINRRYPLSRLIPAVKEFIRHRRTRVTFEYVLIPGVNDRSSDVQRLSQLLADIPCKLNLIPFNDFPGSPYRPPEPSQLKAFAELLYPRLPCLTIRKSRGIEILAGCGQLAGDAA
jgi:23S rRNA (adenine2503-C2)-methyltransferase